MSASPAPQPAPGWQLALGLATVYLVWGSTYLAIRVMVETMPPLLSAGVRFFAAGALMYAALRLRRGATAMRVTRREVLAAAGIGTLLLAGGNGVVTVAERDVPSGLAALIIASVPLWVVVLRSLGGDRPARATALGVALGFAGVALLMLPGTRPAGATTLGLLLCVAAAASWATGSYWSPRAPMPRDPLVATAFQMLLGGGVLVAAGLVGGEAGDVDVASFSGDSLLAFAYLVTIGSLVAFSAYVWLLRHASISLVATYAYVNPVVAVFLGWLILSEEITALTLAAAGVIVASVALVVRRESPSEPAPADVAQESPSVPAPETRPEERLAPART